MANIKLTLSFIYDENRILLGQKKRGFGMGKWNGFGGKVESGEDVQEAAAREVYEETGLRPMEMNPRGVIQFYFDGKDDCMVVSLFHVSRYEGDAEETEEMRPQWFARDHIPYAKMWVDDEVWLPAFLAGHDIDAVFHLSANGDKILQQKMIIDQKTV